MTAVQIGRKAAGNRLVVHLAINGQICRSDFSIHVEVTCETATTRRCKNCWTPARIAIARALVKAAQDANIERASCPARYAEENALIALAGWFLTDAEKAVEAELVARWTKPVVVEAPRTAFAEAAARMGANTKHTVNRRPAGRRTVNAHRRFMPTTKAA